MEEQVLTIEQMQELLDMGVDTSKASMCWINDKASIFLDCNYQSYTEEDKLYLNAIPTFTIQDILEMLPPIINQSYNLEFRIDYQSISYKHWLGNEIIKFEWKDNMLTACFNMLKWCKTHGYI